MIAQIIPMCNGIHNGKKRTVVLSRNYALRKQLFRTRTTPSHSMNVCVYIVHGQQTRHVLVHVCRFFWVQATGSRDDAKSSATISYTIHYHPFTNKEVDRVGNVVNKKDDMQYCSRMTEREIDRDGAKRFVLFE